MTADDVRKRLAKACRAAGSQRAWADQHGIPSGRVSEVLNGIRSPPDAICEALGIDRIVTYRKKARPND